MFQSTYVKNQDAGWVKGTTYAAAPTIRISLHTGDPSLTGANEIAFTRVAPTTFGAIATAENKRQFPINEELTFVNSPITGSATHWGAWDAATTGNFLGGGQFLDENGDPTTIELTTGNDVTIASGSIFFAYNIGVFSNYIIDAKLNWYKGTTFPAAPTDIYSGVGTGLTSSGGGTDSGIAREIITWGGNLTNPNYIRIQSASELDFGGSPSELTLNSLAFYDALTAGNLLWVSLFAVRVYPVGSPISWAIGSINLEF